MSSSYSTTYLEFTLKNNLPFVKILIYIKFSHLFTSDYISYEFLITETLDS